MDSPCSLTHSLHALWPQSDILSQTLIVYWSLENLLHIARGYICLASVLMSADEAGFPRLAKK